LRTTTKATLKVLIATILTPDNIMKQCDHLLPPDKLPKRFKLSGRNPDTLDNKLTFILTIALIPGFLNFLIHNPTIKGNITRGTI
jgi:hypothetical protein